MSGKRILIALSAAAALGILGAACGAQANDSGENNMGGSVVPGSMVGVNPVYHPDWFGTPAGAGSAYGYVATPSHKHSLPEHSRDR